MIVTDDIEIPKGYLGGDTQVWTPDGPQPIEKLESGDQVMIFDQNLRKPDKGKILVAQSRVKSPVYKIVLNDGCYFIASLGQQIIVKGEVHDPWVRADTLVVGMQVGNSVIEKVHKIDEPTKVFAIMVKPVGNFIIQVGEEEIICHDNSTGVGEIDE